MIIVIDYLIAMLSIIAMFEGSLNSNFRQYGELKSSDEKQMR